MTEIHTVILGAGLSGLSAAFQLAGHQYLVIEKADQPGGLCTSENRQGFCFDQTGHWLHMRNDDVKALVASLPGMELVEIERRAHVFSHNTVTQYPFQVNTFGLPPEVVRECVLGFIRARYDGDRSRAHENFYEWCMAHLGEGISRHFMIPYNTKLYTVDPRVFGSHWCGAYIPVPTIEEVVDGALGTSGRSGMGYNARFSYPRSNGIGVLPEALYRACEQERFLFNARPVEIDMQRRVLRLNDGEEIRFTRLISTIALRDFLGLLHCDARDCLQAAAQRMCIASISYYNAAFRVPASHPGHWFYIPESRYMPYRVGIYSNVHAPLAPSGCFSAYIEYSHQGPLADEPAFRRASLELLKDMQFITGDDDVVFMDYRCIENGYVIFHREYDEDMVMIAQWCRDNGVVLAGRYGRWVYSAMEDALVDGMHAAREIRSCAGS